MATPATDVTSAGGRKAHGKWNGFRWWAREGRQDQPHPRPSGASDGGGRPLNGEGQPQTATSGECGHAEGREGGDRGGALESRFVAVSCPWPGVGLYDP